MPRPAGDVDAWIKLAVENKVSWKQLVKPVLTHARSPTLETGETVRFPDCHKDFLIKGLGARRYLFVTSTLFLKFWLFVHTF